MGLEANSKLNKEDSDPAGIPQLVQVRLLIKTKLILHYCIDNCLTPSTRVLFKKPILLLLNEY